jgi:FixJ family two-component response regulator
VQLFRHLESKPIRPPTALTYSRTISNNFWSALCVWMRNAEIGITRSDRVTTRRQSGSTGLLVRVLLTLAALCKRGYDRCFVERHRFRQVRSRISVNAADHIVFIVDDDARIREALVDLLSSHELHAVTFGSATEYMEFPKPDVPACLLLDVELPDMSGLDLQSKILKDKHGKQGPQIVFITGHGDIPSSVRAIKSGAVDFLTKPLKEAELMTAIRAALLQNAETRREEAALVKLRERYLTLTPREREVLPLVIGGLLNKQVAAELGISEITTQIHRGKLMEKMQAGSLAELVRMGGALEIPVTHTRPRKHV